jgi:low temperature requirement protein LtrA
MVRYKHSIYTLIQVCIGLYKYILRYTVDRYDVCVHIWICSVWMVQRLPSIASALCGHVQRAGVLMMSLLMATDGPVGTVGWQR